MRAGFIEFRCGFSLRWDHELRTFTIKVPAIIGDTEAERELIVIVIFEEIEGRIDEAIAEPKVASN